MTMDEKEFIQDVWDDAFGRTKICSWDILRGNTQYITLDKFKEKYDDLFLECYDGTIRLMDEKNEWHLWVQKVWCDHD